MKLPFNLVLAPILKPYLGRTRLFCSHSTFSMSIYYTYIFGALGFIISANHLRKHLGELPSPEHEHHVPSDTEVRDDMNFMLVHDLKIIATSMGLVQYACLIVGCMTENPSLFIPHLAGQLLVVTVKILNALLLLVPINTKAIGKLSHKIPAIILMTFNWLQEFCVFRQYLCILELERSCARDRERAFDRGSIKGRRHFKHFFRNKSLTHISGENSEALKIKLRALLVALLGVSMSACAFASQPVELELDDDEVAQKLNNVSFARRITKPTIRLVMGYGKLSAFVTATTSLLLLVAVMSKQSWWRRGARWLAAPALLVAALETASDASDAMIAAVLRGSAEPLRVIAQTAAAALLITVEILVWYFIAKFFEYNPPQSAEEREKGNLIQPIPE